MTNDLINYIEKMEIKTDNITKENIKLCIYDELKIINKFYFFKRQRYLN
jgi:hypothetical protein